MLWLRRPVGSNPNISVQSTPKSNQSGGERVPCICLFQPTGAVIGSSSMPRECFHG